LIAVVFLHAVAEFSAWIAVLIVAFDRGGSSAAGLAVVVQLAPAAILAPVVAAAGDRFARNRVLAVSFGLEAVSAAGITLALLADAPLAAVYALAAVFTVATIAPPAAVASLLVHHARTPTELMSWNAVRSSAKAAGSLAGPLLAAIVLAFAEPATMFAILGVACAVTALLTAIRLPHDDRLPTELSITRVLTDAAVGLRYVASDPGPRRVVVVMGCSEFMIGALDLVVVAVAFELLGRGGSAAALLTVTFGAGTLLAALLVSRLQSWRLTRLVTVGAALFTVPLIVLGEASLLGVALAVTALLGAGYGMIEVGGQTLLQRSCSETLTSRAFGALTSTSLIAAAVGAALAGRLLDTGDLGPAIAVLGLSGSVVLLGGSVWLRRTERSLHTGDPETVAALRTVSFMAALPQPTLERLARVAERRSATADTAIVVEGTRGDEFFVLIDGAAEVRRGGDVVARLVAPCSFGEVALLHDDVRTATVTTTGPSRLLVVRQGDFLDAISRTATSHHDALAVAQQYRPATEHA
jgi:MFS family permease